jgi:hypothetical protein
LALSFLQLNRIGVRLLISGFIAKKGGGINGVQSCFSLLEKPSCPWLNAAWGWENGSGLGLPPLESVEVVANRGNTSNTSPY